MTRTGVTITVPLLPKEPQVEVEVKVTAADGFTASHKFLAPPGMLVTAGANAAMMRKLFNEKVTRAAWKVYQQVTSRG